jgi:predicted MPP superfamily phosphohydrolase
MSHLTRRQFLTLTGLALPAAVILDTRLIEPTNLRVAHLAAHPAGTMRFVHFSDFHHKGDTAYGERVIRTINEINPEFVCFTGDLVENTKYLDEALDFISQIKVPVYGSPGNHDYWCNAPFSEYERAFSSTGGRWLADDNVVLPERGLEIVGMGREGLPMFKPPQAERRFLLVHYPKTVEGLSGYRFDWIMAGHSHGGQIRLPGYGALALPWGVGRYDLGYFKTDAGPLYVNAGIGTYRIPWRFNCRPEITVVTI